MKNILFFWLVMAPSSNLFAQQVQSLETELLQVSTENSLHIIRTSTTPNVCNGNGLFWWLNSDSNAIGKLSVALAALTSGKKVTVVYDSTNPNCSYGNSAAELYCITINR